jgi:hypothetical protein
MSECGSVAVYTATLYIFISIDELQSFGVLSFSDRSHKTALAKEKE